jgi:hypothetical protein
VKLPEEYWARIERDPLSRGVTQHRWLHTLRVDIAQVTEMISNVQSNRILVWRGQADADYGLSSSLFRKALTVHSMSELNERRLSKLEHDFIGYARRAGLGRCMTNLQLLHALQHYRLPTRLIDVSRDPVSAIWFACNDRAQKDGRLFLFAVPRESVRLDDTNLQMVPWAGIKLSNWTNQVLLLEAPPSNPRMAAQNGAFLVGGLARNYAGQQRLIKDKYGHWRYVPAEQIHEISELFVKFPQEITKRRVDRWKVAETYGVTWRVPALRKRGILHAMRLLGVSERTMYPDFDSAREGLDSALSLG